MKLITHSPAQTRAVGKTIARYCAGGDIICLYGCLGSGKTELTKGIASGLGIPGREVISPTFVLIREYQGRVPLYHFDLYRLDRPDDIAALGYEEYVCNQGVTVIEWTDRLGHLLPPEHLKITLRIIDNTRRLLTFAACGSRYAALLERIHEALGR